MKHLNIFLAFITVTFLCGCNGKEPEPYTFPFEAEVIGMGLDCGSVFLIDLNNISGPAEIADGRYYADNLPSEFQDSGLKILLYCRLLSADEMYPCTTLGPTYPHVYVLEAHKQ